jgi:transcriptional regulator with XRE-family HTH domain
MKSYSKNRYSDVEKYFSTKPTPNQKAWNVIHDFYHIILTFMENNKITKADLSRKLGISRSSVTQMFNKTPNITIKKMVEIADAVGVEVKISTFDQEKIKSHQIDKSTKDIRLWLKSSATAMSARKSRRDVKWN